MMLKPSHGDVGAWAIKEDNDVFLVVDGSGAVLAQVPFGKRTPANLSRSDAMRMAQDMVAAGQQLAKATKSPGT